MKKLIILVLAAVVAFSFAACGGPSADNNNADSTKAPTEQPTEEPTEQPTEEPTEQPTEEPTEAPTEAPTEEPTEASNKSPMDAVIEGDVYTNTYFGISLSVPAGSLWYSKEELEATFGVTYDLMDMDKFADTGMLPLCMCYDPTSEANQVANMNIIFSLESVPQNAEEAEATAQFAADSVDNAFGTETIYAPPTATEFDGHPAYIIETQSYSGDEVVMNQAVVMVEVEEGILTLSYTYFTEDQLNAVIDSVSSISFS